MGGLGNGEVLVVWMVLMVVCQMLMYSCRVLPLLWCVRFLVSKIEIRNLGNFLRSFSHGRMCFLNMSSWTSTHVWAVS